MGCVGIFGHVFDDKVDQSFERDCNLLRRIATSTYPSHFALSRQRSIYCSDFLNLYELHESIRFASFERPMVESCRDRFPLAPHRGRRHSKSNCAIRWGSAVHKIQKTGELGISGHKFNPSGILIWMGRIFLRLLDGCIRGSSIDARCTRLSFHRYEL